jgi:hypothetical protein
MVGIIKNLFSAFSGKDNYYAELDEDQATASENQQSSTQTEQTAAKTASEEPKEVKSAPQSTPASVPQQPVSVQNNGQPPTDELRGETFAPTYLTPKATNSRRFPGANMENFKELAREVKVPRNQS